LKQIINEDEDSVFFYHVRDRKYLGFDELGSRPVEIDTII
jgi:CRISPR-associated protein Cas2